MCYLESFLPLSSPSDLSRRVQTQSSKLTDMTDLDETKIPQRYSGNNRSNLPPCLKVQIHFALYVQPLPERRRSHTRVRILRTLTRHLLDTPKAESSLSIWFPSPTVKCLTVS